MPFAPPAPDELVDEFSPPSPNDLVEEPTSFQQPKPLLTQGAIAGGPRVPLASFGETIAEPLEQLKNPRFTAPESTVTESDNPFQVVGKEAWNLAKGVPEFLSSDVGLMSVVGAEGAPIATSGLFTGLMANDLGQQVLSTYKNWGQLTRNQKLKAVTDMVGTGLFAGLLAKHTTSGVLDRVVPARALARQLDKAEFQPVDKGVIPIERQAVPFVPPPPETEVAEPAPPVPEAKAEPTPPTTSVEAPPAAPTPSEPTPPAKVPTSETPIPPRSLPQYGINSKDVARQYGMPEDFYGTGDESGVVSSKYRTKEYDAAIEAEKRASKIQGVNGPTIRRQARERTEAEFRKIADSARLSSAETGKPAPGTTETPSDYPLTPKSEVKPTTTTEPEVYQSVVGGLHQVWVKLPDKPDINVGSIEQNRALGDRANAIAAAERAWKAREDKAPPVDAIQQEVQKVARTEGQRSAKEVKSELVARLERAIEDSPLERNMEAERSKLPKVTIDIPGDGSFTVFNTKEALGDLLSRAKKIKTDAGKPPSVQVPKERRLAQVNEADMERLIRAYGSAQEAAKRMRSQAEAKGEEYTPEQRGNAEAFANALEERSFLAKNPANQFGENWARLGRWQKEVESAQADIESSEAHVAKITPEERKESQYARAEVKRYQEAIANRKKKLATALAALKEMGEEPARTAPESMAGPGIGQGPGARTYTAKPERPESYEATSLKNAVAELEAAGIGHNLLEPELRKMVPLWQKAGETLSKDSEAGKRLADDLIANPERGMTDEQSALLLRHKVNLMNDLNAAAEKTHTGDTLARVAAEKDYIAKSNELKSLLDSIKKRGTQWGREGRWRQAMAYEDYSFATQEGLLRAAKGGAALTEAERTKLLADIEEWKKNAAEQKAHREKAESKVAELQKQIPPLDKRILAAAEKIVVGLERSARSHSEALKEMLSRMGTSPDPTIILHASHVAAAKIARASLDLAKLTDEMVREYGPKIAPMMGEIWKKANEMLDGIKAPGPVRDTVKSGLARKIKSLEERLASGDYEKPKRPAPRPLDPEGARLAAKGREIEQRFETARRRAVAALRSPLKKVWDRTVGALYNGLRGIKVLWHGTVGMMTHAGGMLYRASKANIWWRNFANQFKMWASPEYHEQLMYRMETDPEFENWLRAGAKIDPRQNYTDYEIYSKLLGEKGGRIMERLQRGGERGFAALKLTRFEADKADWEKVSPDIKNDPEKAYSARKVIAEINNRATGTDSIGGKVGSMNLSDLAHTFFFAPKLYLSRWMRVLIDPVRTAKTFGEWDRASDADKLAAKTRLKHATEFAGIYLGALAVNQGLLSASGSKQRVNFTDPTKSDWLKFKTQGKVVTADGGLLDPIRLIGQVVYGDLIKKRTGKEKYIKGKTRFEAVVHDLGNYARSKLNPSLGLMVDIGTQQDFQGRALPFSSEPSKYKAQKPYKWGEWILSQGPIPISIGTRQIYEDLQKHGLSKPDAAALMEGAAATAVGFTGAHESTDYATQTR